MRLKKLNRLHCLLILFVSVCESTSSSSFHHHSHSTGKSNEFRANQLRKARSSPNQSSNNLTSALNASSSLHKVSFLPEDASFEPTKRHYTHQHHYPKMYGSKHSGPNIKRDLSEPVGFLNAVVNDHATSSTNQDIDTVRYPPNKAYKSSALTSSNEQLQSFSRRQRDFSESPISNPTSSASENNESMNSDDHESDSGSSPFSSPGSSNSHSSNSNDDSPVDSNEDFPSSPTSGNSPSSGSSNSANSHSHNDEESPASYDGFGPPPHHSSSADDEHHARGNSLDDEEHSSAGHSASRPPSLPYGSGSPYGSNPYLSSLSSFGGPPTGPPIGPFRSVYSGAPSPISFPGYRPISSLSPLSYPLISSASSSPLAGSYKAMSSESYPSGPMTTKYRGYTQTNGAANSFAPSDESSSPMFANPFSFDSFPASSDTFGSTPNNFGSFKSSASYGDLMGLNNNWYMNQQQYLPLMMKQAGYPMIPGAYGGMQYQTTTQAPNEQETTKEKDKETTGSKTKNRLRFNLNRLQAIRLNNLKLPSLFNWHKNSTTTTPSSVN